MNKEDHVIQLLLNLCKNNIISEESVFTVSDEYGLSNIQYSKVCQDLSRRGINILPENEIPSAVSSDALPVIDDSFENIVSEFCKLNHEDKKKCLSELELIMEKEDKRHQMKMKDNFISRIKGMRLQYSYIAVLLKSFLSECNVFGVAQLENIVDYFSEFYGNRLAAGLKSEKSESILSKDGFTLKDIKHIITFNPIKRSFLSEYMVYSKKDDTVSMELGLWNNLTDEEKSQIVNICDLKLEEYYSKI